MGVQVHPLLSPEIPTVTTSITCFRYQRFFLVRLLPRKGAKINRYCWERAPDDVACLGYDGIPQQTRLCTTRAEGGMNPPYGAYTERVINWGRRTCKGPSYQHNHESENFGERQDRNQELQENVEPAGGEGSDLVQRANTSTGNEFHLPQLRLLLSAHVQPLSSNVHRGDAQTSRIQIPKFLEGRFCEFYRSEMI